MRTPHGTYDFCCDVMDFDGLVLFSDFECTVSVHCEVFRGELEAYCTDVQVNGTSLRNGGALARLIRIQVMTKADEQFQIGGWLFDQVREAEGLSLTGHPNDPDTRWRAAAE